VNRIDVGSGRIGRRGLIAGSLALGAGTAVALGGLADSSPEDDGVLLAAAADASLPLNWVNVKAAPFSAGGAGSTNDTAAIAAAYASARDNKRPLYFPPGTYKVTSLPAFANYTTVIGAGPDLVTILYEGTGTLLTLNAQRVSIKNIGFWATGTSGTIVDLTNCFRCSFDSVLFRGQHTAASGATFRNQKGIVLRDNTGGTSFVNCDINNLGTGLTTSCIQNYISNSKFTTNYIGVRGTGNNFNAGLALSNTEFVSTKAATDRHIFIDGKSNDWWLTNVWFEGATTGIVAGVAGVGGPSQLGMVNCKVAASSMLVDIQHCRQPYLANVIFDADPGSSPTMLRINGTYAPEGTALNLIHGTATDFATSVFPPGWTFLGRGRMVAAGGPVVKSPDGRSWQITVSNTGALSTRSLGAI
jgi:hypothetical protein